MTTGLVSHSWDLFNPVRLTGPIFDKELRVSSRRFRNYLLRFGYVMLFGIYLLFVWFSIVRSGGATSAVYHASRLSQAGERIIMSMIWFQFIAAQLIAIVMLSSSISDEIRSGTLSVLMTTPISCFQIVAGKLLSKLLQLFILLGISLPLLTIIRVFGGVPWDFIVASICITLTAAVFAGTLSLLLSTTYRQDYTVILMTIIGYMLVFGAIPGIFIFMAAKGGLFSQQATNIVFAMINPFWAMAETTQTMMTSGNTPGFFSWPLHCLIMLGASIFLLVLAVWRVRRAALYEAFGRSGGKSKVKIYRDSPIKHIKGSPIIWKEMRKGFFGCSGTDIKIGIILICVSILAAVFAFSQVTIVISSYLRSGIYIIVMLRMAIATAGSIAGEKDARTWPILLVTTLEDKDIIRGKMIAAIRRNIPLLMLYLILTFIFMVVRVGISRFGFYMVYAFLFMIIGLISSMLLMVGMGSYFGVRFKNATAAIAVTIASYLILEFILGIVFSLFFGLFISRMIGGVTWLFYIVQIVNRMIFGGIGIYLAWCSVRRLRCDIF